MGSIVRRSTRILLVGEHHNVVKQWPMFDKGPELYWWAENGRIAWEDARNNEFGTLSIDECGMRVRNLSAMIGKPSEDKTYTDERIKMQEFICGMEGVLRQAIEQGDPYADDTARVNKRRRPTSIVVPRKLDAVISGDPLKL